MIVWCCDKYVLSCFFIELLELLLLMLFGVMLVVVFDNCVLFDFYE